MPADASYDAVVRGALRLKKTGGSVVEKRSSGKRSKREKREREGREKEKSVEKVRRFRVVGDARARVWR